MVMDFIVVASIILISLIPEIQSQNVIISCVNNGTELVIKHNNSLYIDLVDQSWDDYILEVYGNKTKSNSYKVILKNEINFIYVTTSVQVIPFYWPPSLVKTSAKHILNYISFYNLQHSYPSYSWIEISRFSSDYMWPKFYEGYYHPQWNDYLNSNQKNVKVNYGVWFYLSKGSGIWVNLKRTLVIESRNNLGMYFKGVNTNNCIPGDNGGYCHDKYLCTLAIRDGYDSIQALQLHEIIICDGTNNDLAIVNTACPSSGIELKKGYQPNEVCICSNQSVLLNCGPQTSIFESTKTIATKAITYEQDYRPKTCINYNINHQRIANNSKSIFTYKVLQNLSMVLVYDQATSLSASIFDKEYHKIHTEYHNPLLISINIQLDKIKLNFYQMDIFGEKQYFSSNIVDLSDNKHIYEHKNQQQLLLDYNQWHIKSIMIQNYNNEMLSIIAFNHINNNRLNVNDIIREIIDNALCLRTLNSKFISLVIRLQSYMKLEKQIKYLYGYIDLIIIINYNDNSKMNKCQDNLEDNYYMNYDELITSNYSSSKVIPIIRFPYFSNYIQTISIANERNITNVITNRYFIN